jgi:hypothetical protein
VLPIRPHVLCLDHKHHLAVGGQTISYDHSVNLRTPTCNLCEENHLDRATWLELPRRSRGSIAGVAR